MHDTVGHLGIFVSGGVAKKEHQEFASNIDLIDVLPPGLYEAVMTRRTADAANPEAIVGDWIVRFEPRTLDDMRAIVQPDPENERRFATVRRVSEINLGLYRTLVQPFVRASVNEQTAEWMKKLKPRRAAVRDLLRAQPADAAGGPARGAGARAAPARCARQPVAAWQAQVSDGIIAALDGYRDQRDSTMEKIFLAIYGSPAAAGDGRHGSPRTSRVRKKPGHGPGARGADPGAHRRAEGGHRRGRRSRGGDPGPALYRHGGAGADERMFNTLRQMRAENDGLTLQAFKRDRARTVSSSLMLDRGRGPRRHSEDAAGRRRPGARAAGGGASDRPAATGEVTGERAERLARVEALLGDSACDGSAGGIGATHGDKNTRELRGPGHRQV